MRPAAKSMLTPMRISLCRHTLPLLQIAGCVICCATVSAVNEVMRSSWNEPGGRSGAGLRADAGRGPATIASPASNDAHSLARDDVPVAKVLIADSLSRVIAPPP